MLLGIISIFRASPVIALASILAFWAGEFVNSFILAKLKLLYSGKFEGLRYILSTLFGQLVDNSIAIGTIVVLSNIFAPQEALVAAVTSVIFCTAWELCALPLTTRLIRIIKAREGIDTYDRGTKFSPFRA